MMMRRFFCRALKNWFQSLQALGLKRLSIHTSFFEAGGTSLLAGMASLRLNHILGSDFSALLFFNHPTIASAASHIRSQTLAGGLQTAAPALLPAGFTEADKQAGLPCSFNQAQMISHGMQSAYALAANQPFAFRMQGDFRPDVLQAFPRSIIYLLIIPYCPLICYSMTAAS